MDTLCSSFDSSTHYPCHLIGIIRNILTLYRGHQYNDPANMAKQTTMLAHLADNYLDLVNPNTERTEWRTCSFRGCVHNADHYMELKAAICGLGRNAQTGKIESGCIWRAKRHYYHTVCRAHSCITRGCSRPRRANYILCMHHLHLRNMH